MSEESKKKLNMEGPEVFNADGSSNLERADETSTGALVEQGKRDSWVAVLRNHFPEDLRMMVTWFCREDEALFGQCFEVLTGFGREGLEIVLTLEFLQKMNGDSSRRAIRQDTANIKQEVTLLMALFKNIRSLCVDFQVDPLVLVMKLVKSKPGVSLLELLDMIQLVMMKMIAQAYLIRHQQELIEIDWNWDEFWMMAQNFEMVMRHNGREEAFKYLRTYIHSSTGFRPSRKNLH